MPDLYSHLSPQILPEQLWGFFESLGEACALDNAAQDVCVCVCRMCTGGS